MNPRTAVTYAALAEAYEGKGMMMECSRFHNPLLGGVLRHDGQVLDSCRAITPDAMASSQVRAAKFMREQGKLEDEHHALSCVLEHYREGMTEGFGLVCVDRCFKRLLPPLRRLVEVSRS